jgi:eukaryotic-like serine/threonine-protein kinase
MTPNGAEIFRFGPFLLDTSEHHLLRDGEPVPLQPKAYETLLFLVRNNGKLVLKNDLLKTVWGHTVVEESNVSQNIFILRKALGDGQAGHRYIITVPGRGYRFEAKVETGATDPQKHARSNDSLPTQRRDDVAQAKSRLARAVLGIGVVVLSTLAALFAYRNFRQPINLTEKDTVVLADFLNSTGDPVFDGTLREGLSAQLEQSPFLNLLPEQQIAETLSLMAQPKGARLTPALATDVCLRTNSAAILLGSISQVGTKYLLTLKAVKCANGRTLASEEAHASDKNQVLDALSSMAAAIRTKLGESLASVEKFDTTLEKVTTPSLEALQAYTLGVRAMFAKADPDSIPLFERAASLDPNFAMAYMRLGTNYFNMDETSRASLYMQKAYALRERTSVREQLHIAANYHAIVTRNLEESRRTLELWIQLYPRDWRAFGNLCVIYGFLADYEKGLSTAETALKLSPGNALNYSNLITSYLQLNRLAEAQATAREARSHSIDSPFIHANLYLVAFLQWDTALMAQEAKAVMDTPGWQDLVLYNESDTAAFAGQFIQARELTRRAGEIAVKADRQETMAAYLAEGALRDALVGNFQLAREQASRALSFSDAREVAAMTAISWALSGDAAAAIRLGTALESRFPDDTIVKYNSLPLIRAVCALSRGDATGAIDALATAEPYESGQTTQLVTFTLYPVYFRGIALLRTKNGKLAAAEFQKLIDNPGLVQNEIIGALAHLGLGRAAALSGDVDAAASAYNTFFALWKSADANLPLLKTARSEFARLHST